MRASAADAANIVGTRVSVLAIEGNQTFDTAIQRFTAQQAVGAGVASADARATGTRIVVGAKQSVVA